MTEIVSIIAAVCAALSLFVSLLILKNQKKTPASYKNQDENALLQQLDRANYIAEQNAKNSQNYLTYLGQQQGEKLQGVQDKLEALNQSTERRLAEIQRVVSGEIRYMAEQNAKNLEQIRETVDEKLSSTLENRLNKSYSIINERLEAVYKGIGEVQQLAGSVADIKKVFANVKLRGTWGEVQLSALLEQMLSPSQYRANVRINPMDNAVVEYAVLLPSRDGETVYLPIDSKFPVEEYRRLLDAGDACDKEASKRALKNRSGRGGRTRSRRPREEKPGTGAESAGGFHRQKIHPAAADRRFCHHVPALGRAVRRITKNAGAFRISGGQAGHGMRAHQPGRPAHDIADRL